MVLIDLFLILLPTALSIGTIIFSFGMLYQRVKAIESSLRILNHNSDIIVKSLLYKGVLKPTDVIKDT